MRPQGVAVAGHSRHAEACLVHRQAAGRLPQCLYARKVYRQPKQQIARFELCHQCGPWLGQDRVKLNGGNQQVCQGGQGHHHGEGVQGHQVCGNQPLQCPEPVRGNQKGRSRLGPCCEGHLQHIEGSRAQRLAHLKLRKYCEYDFNENSRSIK